MLPPASDYQPDYHFGARFTDALFFHPHFTAAEKFVLATILAVPERNPAYSYLTRATHLSRHTISEATRNLESAGVATFDRPSTWRDRRTPTDPRFDRPNKLTTVLPFADYFDHSNRTSHWEVPGKLLQRLPASAGNSALLALYVALAVRDQLRRGGVDIPDATASELLGVTKRQARRLRETWQRLGLEPKETHSQGNISILPGATAHEPDERQVDPTRTPLTFTADLGAFQTQIVGTVREQAALDTLTRRLGPAVASTLWSIEVRHSLRLWNNSRARARPPLPRASDLIGPLAEIAAAWDEQEEVRQLTKYAPQTAYDRQRNANRPEPNGSTTSHLKRTLKLSGESENRPETPSRSAGARGSKAALTTASGSGSSSARVESSGSSRRAKRLQVKLPGSKGLTTYATENELRQIEAAYRPYEAKNGQTEAEQTLFEAVFGSEAAKLPGGRCPPSGGYAPTVIANLRLILGVTYVPDEADHPTEGDPEVPALIESVI